MYVCIHSFFATTEVSCAVLGGNRQTLRRQKCRVNVKQMIKENESYIPSVCFERLLVMPVQAVVAVCGVSEIGSDLPATECAVQYVGRDVFREAKTNFSLYRHQRS